MAGFFSPDSRFPIDRIYGTLRPDYSIDKLSVVFAVILAIILFGEKVSLVHACAIAMIAAGGLILAIW